MTDGHNHGKFWKIPKATAAQKDQYRQFINERIAKPCRNCGAADYEVKTIGNVTVEVTCKVCSAARTYLLYPFPPRLLPLFHPLSSPKTARLTEYGYFEQFVGDTEEKVEE